MKSKKKLQSKLRLQRDGNAYRFLVGMETGKTLLESGLAVSLKVTFRSTVRFRHSPLGICPRFAYVHAKICTEICIAALFS